MRCRGRQSAVPNSCSTCAIDFSPFSNFWMASNLNCLLYLFRFNTRNDGRDSSALTIVEVEPAGTIR